MNPDAWRFTNPIWEWAFGMGVYGAVSGVGFGVLFSLKRVALWGLLGSAAVPAVFAMLGWLSVGTPIVDIVQAMLVTGFLSGAFAPGTVGIARRAELKAGEQFGYFPD